ncbi:DUF2809 domain-containing protein [Flavobacterium sp. JAS]|uniref:ribosomal maturation YjgA family protein n=1 Tax=Flavobacterium sp. JAS TaxID=2897329 RepID=UPI001E412855|nr:DUF2809 domain-containing protein [Flavobacterium sp. JAS]MCD0468982.1 DUF2809 domain-containing protein [Flavobacterium sp. JAS]
MKKSRIYYSILFLLTIFLGILSRKIPQVPLITGDFLYAVMIYLLVRIVFTDKKALYVIMTSLLICYSIEFLQLYQGNWMIELRKTLLGRYALGQGFLWSDILAYTLGIAFVFCIERIVLKYTNQASA